jgi:hypothetical protein
MRRVLKDSDRLQKPYSVQEGWCNQLLFHEDSGFYWDLGTEYVHEGWVDRLNNEFADGLYAVPEDAMVTVPNAQDVQLDGLKIAAFRDTPGSGKYVKARLLNGENRELVVCLPRLKLAYNLDGLYPSNALLLEPGSDDELKAWINSLSDRVKALIWENPSASKSGARDASKFEWKQPIVVPDNPSWREEIKVKMPTGQDGKINLDIMDEQGNPKPTSEVKGFDTIKVIVTVGVLRNVNTFSLTFRINRAVWYPYKREQVVYEFPPSPMKKQKVESQN